MCVANSARSQLAEGLARKIFPNATVESAGSQPGKLNPFAVRVMNEIGIDIGRHFSKSIDELPSDFLKNLDFVVTLCAEEVCPTLMTRAKRLHWPLKDPATRDPLPDEEALERFRTARDQIQEKLLQFRKEHFAS
jgi:arsenate reductase